MTSTLPAAFSRGLCALMEGVTLLLVVAAPWAIGSTEPAFEGLLLAGVGLLTVLWGLRLLVEGRLGGGVCPLMAVLAGLFLLGILQLTPLPGGSLGWLSPGTARLQGELLPGQPEQLPGRAGHPVVELPARARLSLYPGATRRELIRLLAVLLLIGVVRYNVASPAALPRLAVVATVNGALLGFFALAQGLSSPPNVLFWTYVAPNKVFGPFICRNHFPFYVNLCVGMAVGLLLARAPQVLPVEPDLPLGHRRRRRIVEPPLDMRGRLARYLNDPPGLWLTLALILMAGSVAMSLSRGGLLALGVAALLLAGFSLFKPGRLGTLLGIGGVALLVLILLLWLGLDPLRSRLSTLWKGDALEDGRVSLWADTAVAARDFPVWGTGFGTFQYVEPMYRTQADAGHWVYEHAHNEYLEALVEGGLVRLALGLAACVWVYLLGVRALRRYAGGPTAGLVAGALFGFTTVVAHSVVDFGLHNPAIVVLAAVLCAHLAALGAPEATATPQGIGSRSVVRLAGLTAAVAMAWVLAGEGWRMAQARSLQLSAHLLDDAGDLAGRERRLELLVRAAQLTPERAESRLEAAHAYLALHDSVTADPQRRRQLLVAAGGVGLVPVTPLDALALPAVESLLERQTVTDTTEADRRYFLPGLECYLQARDLCPLLPRPQMRLAAVADRLAVADPMERYLDRAARVAPSDPTRWYLAGTLELAAGLKDRAWHSWQRSLALSDRQLRPVVEQASAVLSPPELLQKVLPPKAATVWAAAEVVAPDRDDPARRAFAEKALELLPAGGKAADLHLRAILLVELGRPDEAVASYRAALAHDPRNVAWRFELARLLYDQERFDECQNELGIVLARQPSHADARQMQDSVSRRIAEGR